MANATVNPTQPEKASVARVFRLAAQAVLLGAVVSGVAPASAQTFSRVRTELRLGQFDYVLAVADLNGDGRDDVVVGGTEGAGFGAPAERFNTNPLHLFVSLWDGRFRLAPELVAGTIRARNPHVVVAADFNGDRRADLAVFDTGVTSPAAPNWSGNPPALWLTGADGRLHFSTALADAVQRETTLRPSSYYSGPADLSVNSATAADIEGDGDVDMWVESAGGYNVRSHLMVNRGDATFDLDTVRVPRDLVHNPGPETWRHLSSVFLDFDNDGDPDLALGQMRDLDPTHINQFSLVLINDGTGNYRQRIELPYPAFNNGLTLVGGLVGFDVNKDGFQDLILVHSRRVGWAGEMAGTGRHIQILINDGGVSFIDETTTWLADQSRTMRSVRSDGSPLGNLARPVMHDVHGDGCKDLIMVRSGSPIQLEAPLVYKNDGRGRFSAMAPAPFVGSERDFGIYAGAADVNGDGLVDFVVPHRIFGPDGVKASPDDRTNLITLLNTTPPGSRRCEP